MDITTLDNVRVGDTIEIVSDGADKTVVVTSLRTVTVGSERRCEVGVKIALLTYAWDRPADTEVFIVSRGGR